MSAANYARRRGRTSVADDGAVLNARAVSPLVPRSFVSGRWALARACVAGPFKRLHLKATATTAAASVPTNAPTNAVSLETSPSTSTATAPHPSTPSRYLSLLFSPSFSSLFLFDTRTSSRSRIYICSAYARVRCAHRRARVLTADGLGYRTVPTRDDQVLIRIVGSV